MDFTAAKERQPHRSVSNFAQDQFAFCRITVDRLKDHAVTRPGLEFHGPRANGCTCKGVHPALARRLRHDFHRRQSLQRQGLFTRKRKSNPRPRIPLPFSGNGLVDNLDARQVLQSPSTRHRRMTRIKHALKAVDDVVCGNGGAVVKRGTAPHVARDLPYRELSINHATIRQLRLNPRVCVAVATHQSLEQEIVDHPPAPGILRNHGIQLPRQMPYANDQRPGIGLLRNSRGGGLGRAGGRRIRALDPASPGYTAGQKHPKGKGATACPTHPARRRPLIHGARVPRNLFP